MKVKVKEVKTEKAIEFPRLMESNFGRIVLFKSKSEGTTIRPSKSDVHVIGDITTYSEVSHFKPFSGSVTLSND